MRESAEDVVSVPANIRALNGRCSSVRVLDPESLLETNLYPYVI